MLCERETSLVKRRSYIPHCHVCDDLDLFDILRHDNHSDVIYKDNSNHRFTEFSTVLDSFGESNERVQVTIA